MELVVLSLELGLYDGRSDTRYVTDDSTMFGRPSAMEQLNVS
jgi:hypothetical protein